MMTVDGKSRSRNTYLSQNFSPVNNFAQQNNSTISMSINPFDLGKPVPSSNFIQTSIKTLATSGATINLSLSIPNLIFQTLREFLDVRYKLRNKNTGNNSTIIQENFITKVITIYGRLDGANGTDTINICRLVKQLAGINNQIVQFYNVTPKNYSFSHGRLQQIKEMNLQIENVAENEKEIIQLLNTRSITEEQYDQNLNRDQATFKANIIQKYIGVPNFNIHKCFACDYMVESNFIGSHIYRYADIKRDFLENKLTNEQAAHLIVSGDNGFLLCPTQDVEYEKGMIIFDLNSKTFIANEKKLTSGEFKQVQSNIHTSSFIDVPLTEEFVKNINEHYKRIKYEKN
jgi:hypothetical protein